MDEILKKRLALNIKPFEMENNSTYQILAVDKIIGRYRVTLRPKGEASAILKKNYTREIYKTPKTYIPTSNHYDVEDLFKPKKNYRLEKENALMLDSLRKFRTEKLSKNTTESRYFRDPIKDPVCTSKYFHIKNVANGQTFVQYIIDNFTPVEDVFRFYKNEHSDAIIMLEWGCRFRLFDKDAELVSQILGVQCNPDKNYATASVPIHRLYPHLLKLVNHRLKVALILQSHHFTKVKEEDTLNKKSYLKQRYLHSLYTKSTLLESPLPHFSSKSEEVTIVEDDGNLPGSLVCVWQPFLKHNQSVWNNDARICFLSIRFATGELNYHEFTCMQRKCSNIKIAISGLFHLMDAVETSEIILPTLPTVCPELNESLKIYIDQKAEIGNTIRLEKLPKSMSEKPSITDVINEILRDNRFSKLNISSFERILHDNKDTHSPIDSRLQLFAIIYQYLSTGFHNLPEVFVDQFVRFLTSLGNEPSIAAKSKPTHCQLNPSSQKLTELLYSELLSKHCATPFGRRKLKTWLNSPLVNLSHIEDRLDAVGEIVSLIKDDITDQMNQTKLSLLNSFLNINNGLAKKPDLLNENYDLNFKNDLQKLNNLIKLRNSKPTSLFTLINEILTLDKYLKVLNTLPAQSQILYASSELSHLINSISVLVKDISFKMRRIYIGSGLLNLQSLKQNDTENMFNLPNDQQFPRDLATAELLNVVDTLLPKLNEMRYVKFEIMQRLKGYIDSLGLNGTSKCLTNNKLPVPDVYQLLNRPNPRVGTNLCIQIDNSQSSMIKPPTTWTKIIVTQKLTRYKTPHLVKFDEEFNDWNDSFTTSFSEIWDKFLQSFQELFYEDIKQLLDNIAHLDALMALAKISSNATYTRPFFIQHGSILHIEGGLHPLKISSDCNANINSEFISNDTLMDMDSRRCIILTGPNGSGKSLYLLQVCFLSLLAQVGCYVPATRYLTTIFDAIFIKFGLAKENITGGTSLGYAEFIDTAFLLNNVTSQSLILIDELGLSTSLTEAQALSYAVVSYLVNEVKCLTIFVTHFPSVTELATIYPECIVNCQMATIIEEIYAADMNSSKADQTQLTFLFKCIDGVSPQSYGQNTALKVGIIDEINQRAQEIIKLKQISTNEDKNLLTSFLKEISKEHL